jgi:hypothetical protein
VRYFLIKSSWKISRQASRLTIVLAAAPVGAENLCHLGRCHRDRGRFGQAARRRPGRSWLGRRWDDLGLMGLKLVFLVVSRVMSLLRLSRRESWWKDAEILMLRHQLAVAERERPKARVRLLDALREGTMPAIRQHDGTELLS